MKIRDGVEAMRERNDVLAWLRQRQRAAEVVAARHPENADESRMLARQIGIQIEMIEQGLHEGCAAIAEGVTNGAR